MDYTYLYCIGLLSFDKRDRILRRDNKFRSTLRSESGHFQSTMFSIYSKLLHERIQAKHIKGKPITVIPYWSCLQKKENYRGSDVKCSPLAKFSKKCLVGHNSEVRSGCDVRYSTIGDNCLLREYSFISNSIVMHGAKIGKNRHIRDTIIG